jgi:hypothetical protein
MDAIYQEICHHIAQNLKTYGIGGGLILFTAAANMPKPGVKWTKLVIYTWFYDTLQTVLPLNRGGHQIPQIPQFSQLQSLHEEPKQETPESEIKPNIPMPPRYGVK